MVVETGSLASATLSARYQSDRIPSVAVKPDYTPRDRAASTLPHARVAVLKNVSSARYKAWGRRSMCRMGVNLGHVRLCLASVLRIYGGDGRRATRRDELGWRERGERGFSSREGGIRCKVVRTINATSRPATAKLVERRRPGELLGSGGGFSVESNGSFEAVQSRPPPCHSGGLSGR